MHLPCFHVVYFPGRLVQDMPILVYTDNMRRVGPIVYARCPSVAPNRGALPRVWEPNEHYVQQIKVTVSYRLDYWRYWAVRLHL